MVLGLRSSTSLCLQIARLEQTWMVLRQRHTEGAILYEKKLKPFLKSLNEGKGEKGSSHLPPDCSFLVQPSTSLLGGHMLESCVPLPAGPDASRLPLCSPSSACLASAAPSFPGRHFITK